jgi:hypothetical protein
MAQTDYVSTDLIGVNFYQIDTSPTQALNTECKGKSATHGPCRMIYLKGVASTAEGSVVTFDEVGVTTALAANAQGPVAVALGATVANTYGWYQIGGKAACLGAASSADNADVGYEGAAFTVGDGRAAGDAIAGAMARSATDTPTTGMIWVQLNGAPFVDDFQGA